MQEHSRGYSETQKMQTKQNKTTHPSPVVALGGVRVVRVGAVVVLVVLPAAELGERRDRDHADDEAERHRRRPCFLFWVGWLGV
jgi:hypothetical protein